VSGGMPKQRAPDHLEAALLTRGRRQPRRSSGAPYLQPLRKSLGGGRTQPLRGLAASVEPLDDRPRTLGRPASLPPLARDDISSEGRTGGGSEEQAALKKQVEELQDSLAAATARAELAERKLAKAERQQAAGAPKSEMEQRLMVRNWRLSSQLAASKRRSSPRPQPPPPSHSSPDPAAGVAGLVEWLGSGGTDTVCSVAAKAAAATVRLCGHALPEGGVVDAACKAAAAAAAKELPGLNTIKAALEAAAEHVTSATGLQPTSSTSSSSTAAGSRLTKISNPQAREWWRIYIGDRPSVRSQVVITAFASWFEKHDLSEAEAQIFGALAVYGIDEDEDGDITVRPSSSSSPYERTPVGGVTLNAESCTESFVRAALRIICIIHPQYARVGGGVRRLYEADGSRVHGCW
jgi:hypothetical protein